MNKESEAGSDGRKGKLRRELSFTPVRKISGCLASHGSQHLIYQALDFNHSLVTVN